VSFLSDLANLLDAERPDSPAAVDPVLGDLVAAAGAAHGGVESRVRPGCVVDAARFELARRQLTGGVEQHRVRELGRNGHLLCAGGLTDQLKQRDDAVRGFVEQHLERGVSAER
jgi:hypothetical protein